MTRRTNCVIDATSRGNMVDYRLVLVRWRGTWHGVRGHRLDRGGCPSVGAVRPARLA